MLHEVKPIVIDRDPDARERDLLIQERVTAHLKGKSFRQVADAIGYHHETVRRYMRGISKMPADFVAQVSVVYGADADYLLNLRRPLCPSALRYVDLSDLFTEIGNRFGGLGMSISDLDQLSAEERHAMYSINAKEGSQ